MERRHGGVLVISALSFLIGGVTLAQDRFSLMSPNGIAFSEFKGYESWQVIGVSTFDDARGCGASAEPGCIKTVVANSSMIEAYEAGIPANGKPVPDGAVFAKIEWQKKREVSASAATMPGTLTALAFMVKDSRRFPATNGWGYAMLRRDAASDTWAAFGDGPDFGIACHVCHTLVAARDFVFTSYLER